MRCTAVSYTHLDVYKRQVLGLSAYTRHSRFVKNNSYAETVFYAAQSSLNHYASSGQMQELKAVSYTHLLRGSIRHSADFKAEKGRVTLWKRRKRIF